MRIALIHLRHAEVGGTERFMNRMAGHLAELGHEVSIVCRRHEALPHPRVRFVVLHGLAVGGAWRAWRFAQDVEAHVAEARYDLTFALGKTWTHDVIRSGGGCHQTYLDNADRHARGAWERATGFGALKNRVALDIEARAYAPGASRRVIVNSDMVRRDLMARYGLPESLIELIYNGVDLERFHPRHRAESGAAWRARNGYGSKETVVLFLGSGFGRKGLAPLLAAFARVSARRPELRLAVVGRDGAQAQYESLAHELILGERVRFLGESRTPEECYAGADLYALPTRYDPFAHTVLEALASGLPVLTTNGTGASELLGPEHGEVLPAPGVATDTDATARRATGDEASVEAFAAALERWADRSRLAAAAPAVRALAEQYPFERTLSLTTKVLMEAAEEKTR